MPLKLLSFKFAFLLALASGKRRGEIYAIQKAYKISNHGMKVFLKPRADFLGKTHIVTHGKGTFREIELPRLVAQGQEGSADANLCPVTVLCQYINRTKPIRNDKQERSVISFMPNIKNDIGKQTISNYIRQAVVLAYEDAITRGAIEGGKTPHFHPHEARQVACSIKAATGATNGRNLASRHVANSQHVYKPLPTRSCYGFSIRSLHVTICGSRGP